MRVLLAKCSLVGLIVLVLGMVMAVSASAKEVHIHSSTFGMGDFSLTEQSGVAVNQETGDVYVGDTGKDRIARYGESGEPEGTLATVTEPTFLAVDNSTGGSNGDLYVVEQGDAITKLDSLGAPVTTWGTTGHMESFGEILGIAVDPSGNLFVLGANGVLHEFGPDGSEASHCAVPYLGTQTRVARSGIAVDSSDDVYSILQGFYSESWASHTVDEITSTCEPVTSAFGGEYVDWSGIAIDEADESLFRSRPLYHGETETEIELISADESQVERFGRYEEFEGPGQLAVRSQNGTLYATDFKNGEIGIFSVVNVEPPEVTIDPSSDVTGTTARFRAEINPEAPESHPPAWEVKYRFHCVPGCNDAGLEGSLASGSETSTVEGTAEHLFPGTEYQVYITAENAGGVARAPLGPEGGLPFHTETIAPSVEEAWVAEASGSTATVAVVVDPGGTQTGYRVKYVTKSQFEASGFAEAQETSEALVTGAEGVVVEVKMTELSASTPYVARLVAVNEDGTAVGPDVVFTTQALALAGLPDGRGYEMVTPADNEGAEPYVPDGAGTVDETAIETEYPVRAAVDGDVVAYVGSPTSGGNGSQGNGEGNQFLARRGVDGGWTQTNIQPDGYSTPVYQAFSPDLEHAVLDSSEPLMLGASAGGYDDLYVRDNTSGDYQSLFTGTPPHRTAGEFGASAAGGFLTSLGGYYAGASADYSHFLFEANDVLASGAANPGVGANNLYESVDGRVRTVNVLPGNVAAPDASFGAPELEGAAPVDFSHVISADGSRVFWTDMKNGSLYVREDGKVSKLIAEDATYLTASADGSKVLYAKAGDLYEENLESTQTSDLAPGGEVLGLAGTSEDLEYVYLVARGVLAEGGTAGKSNLYLLQDGQPRFIAALGTPSEEEASVNGLYVAGEYFPWQSDIGRRTAEATPSGEGLVFMSGQSLTGYDNVNQEGRKVPEVYVYDADSGALSCASCNPAGARLAPTSASKPAALLAISEHPTYQLHSISEDGSRVFFESAQPLVSQAQNGETNVYEWEREGSGSCMRAGGCIYLLSNGSSPQPSYLIDASASGDDVFFITRSQLVPADQNDLYDLYDARVGATEGAVSAQCTGTGCQGVAASPPLFATPASATFDGVGNFAPMPTPAARPKAKPKKKTRGCTKRRGKRSKKKSKAKESAKRVKAKSVPCKAKKAVRKAARRAQRGTSGRDGR